MRNTFWLSTSIPASPQAPVLLRIAVSGAVCGLLTCAIVFGQDPKAMPAPAQPDLKTAKKKLVDAKVVVESPKNVKAKVLKGIAKAAAVVNFNGNPMIQQWAQQGRPIVRAELLFVRHVCSLAPEQLRQIGRETDEALNDTAKKMVEGQQQGVRIRRAGQPDTNPDAVKLLQDGLALVIKKHLSPDQYAQYRSEFDKRSANRKQAALGFMVDVLDRELVLSSQQREKVTESLSSHWDDGWCMYMEYLLSGNQFYPSDMDRYVTPLLNDNQKKVWQGVQKVQGFWGFGNTNFGMINDGDPLLAEIGLEEKAEPNPHPAVGIMKGAVIAAPVMKVPMRKVQTKQEAVTKK